ncbi:MAG: hypothetical protein Q9170_002618 [Blastenia crenularia]
MLTFGAEVNKSSEGRAKRIFREACRGELFWPSGKSSQKAPGNGATIGPAPDTAKQRSLLAKESTDLREKQEAEREQKRAEREATRTSLRRERGSSNASSFSERVRRRTRRPSRLSNVQTPVRCPPTLEQSIRYGQQHGKGIEAVAEEILSRNNSAANLQAVDNTNRRSVQKARSAGHLAVEGTAEKASVDGTAGSVVKGEDIRATKSAADLRVESEDEVKYDSGRGSSVEERGSLGVNKQVSISSSRYSRPETGDVVDPANEEEEDMGITMAALAAVMA